MNDIKTSVCLRSQAASVKELNELYKVIENASQGNVLINDRGF